MRIAYSYQGREKIFDRGAAQVLIGRSADGVVVDLDLRPDWTASPLHARLWFEDGQYWIEDLGSEHGTQINDEEIKGKGKRPLGADDVAKIGETELRIQAPAAISDPSGKQSSKEATEHILEITPSLDASKAAFDAADLDHLDASRRLTLFYELPLQFGEETRLDALLQLIVERVVSVIPGAERGAVLVKDRNGKLALKAHLPVGRPAVSLTMAERAMDQRSAFIWPPISLTKEPIPDSVNVYRIESAMYAPLLWRGETFGAVCVDNDTGGAFSGDDL